MNKILIGMYCLLFGLNFHVFQKNIGMRNLSDGVDYYAEVHLSFWNSLIHTFFMPFTMLGMYIWVPAVFNLHPNSAHLLKQFILLFYIGLYCRISLLVTIYVIIWYYPTYYISKYFYHMLYFRQINYLCLKCGLAVSLLALLIQEIFGHFIGGDKASRIDAVFNAILYAPYYSVDHLYKYI